MISFRQAEPADVDLIFDWANDELTRKNSFNSDPVKYETHVTWFNNQLQNAGSIILIFFSDQVACGQVRFNMGNETIIGITIAREFRGRSLGKIMLKEACDFFFTKFPKNEITAYIKEENKASISAFEKAGFLFYEKRTVSNCESVVYKKRKEEIK
ncbi:GNAT family N-acetyltransferase [Solitalea sp. MAHUQ-68]|uniref:GNAT family N-acetyltransferase n=1 Tax=Solitalea agri TaxID=2953739 RepID=A0A9X2JBX5_9SPHI|nr:GNAT family N-acetyltransferase [Solitalea agri]MCO4292942.1 GNAT family N-acetyltransferase [Solitalea agri]